MMPYIVGVDPETGELLVGNRNTCTFFLRGSPAGEAEIRNLVQAANERTHQLTNHELPTTLCRRSMSRDEFVRICEKREKRGALILHDDLNKTPPDTLVIEAGIDSLGIPLRLGNSTRDGVRFYVKIYHPSLPIVPEAGQYPVVGPDLKVGT